MLAELENIKNRAKYISQYFEIRDGENRQLLISTQVNNPQNASFNDVIDNYVNDPTFKVLEIKLGNSPGDSKKVTYYLSAAGYEGEESNFAQLLAGHRAHQNGVVINGIEKTGGSVEELIANKLAAYDAQLQERLLEEKFLSKSRELEIIKEYNERELKLKEEAQKENMKVLEAQLKREREERATLKDIGRGAMEFLAGIGKEWITGNNRLSGIDSKDKPSEETKAIKPKKSPISFQIVNQNNAGKEEEKANDLASVLSGLSQKKKALVLQIIQESEDEDFVEDLEAFLKEDSEEEIQEAEIMSHVEQKENSN
ncbi:MAG: hypothetical protein CMO01_09215 [Thalassobius sp.]|nr:hypothetical protein [Thalassovita sp.]